MFLRRTEEKAAMRSELQGIGSILGSEPEKPKTPASLRRTLSADMSSKKWSGRHGFTPVKKIPSSESFPLPPSPSSSSSSSSSFSSEGEEDDNWSSIFKSKEVEHQKKKEEHERPGLSDIWGSILSQKAGDSSKSSSAPYIHPLVKRSKSALSQRSLEICTESLGSETGSDQVFSPYSLTQTRDIETKSSGEEQMTRKTEQVATQATIPWKEKEEFGAAARKSAPRSFPPPLPSLSRREGPGFLMQSHRRDGRLVLEAVPVPSYNYFQAERQDGRLRLSFINQASQELEEEEELDYEVETDLFEFEEFEEDEETDEAERATNGVHIRGIGGTEEVVKGSQPPIFLSNKLMGFANKNPNWPLSHKKNVPLEEEEEEEILEEDLKQLPQSLPCPPRVVRLMRPPPPTVAPPASFNAYDYFWRTEPALTQQKPPPPAISNANHRHHSNYFFKTMILNSNVGLKPQERQKQGLELRGNETDSSVSSMRGGCKDPRSRSLFIPQPPTACIATS